MAKTRIEDIRSEAKFGQKLFRLGESIDRKGPAAIAEALYGNDACFKVIAPRGRDVKYKANIDKDLAAIMRRVQDHLDLVNAYDVPSNYMYAYSILFNISLDYLYGKIDEECPNLEILDISKKTGLSIPVAQRLVECSRDGESPIVDCWSAIMGSPLYDSVYVDWRFITNTVYEKIDLEARLATLEWEKQYFSEKNIDPKDAELFEFPRDIDYEINNVKESIANIDAAFYGMLSKISKNFADFIESNAKAHYKASKEKIAEQHLQSIQQIYKLISI